MSPGTKNKKVLIIDDEADMVTFLSTILDTHGYEPVVAYDRDQALKKAKEKPLPACIILNAMMSGDEGFLVYRELKQEEGPAKTPVIMLSAVKGKTIFQGVRHDGKMSEPEAYIESPPEADELVHLVHRLAGA